MKGKGGGANIKVHRPSFQKLVLFIFLFHHVHLIRHHFGDVDLKSFRRRRKF